MIEIIQFYSQQKQLFDGLHELDDQPQEQGRNTPPDVGEPSIYQQVRAALLRLTVLNPARSPRPAAGITMRMIKANKHAK